jgi:hypothetical protein
LAVDFFLDGVSSLLLTSPVFTTSRENNGVGSRSYDSVERAAPAAVGPSALSRVDISAADSSSKSEAGSYPDRVSVTNTSSAAQPPSPCTDGQFRIPIFEFSNLTVFKNFFNDNDTNPLRFLSTVNFTLRDVANNYSFHCNWGPRNPGAGPSWETQDCVPETGSILDPSRSVTLLNLWPEFLMLNKSREDPVRIVQYWYCDPRNGSYP